MITKLCLKCKRRNLKKNGEYKDKHISFARGDFTRPLLDTAHAVLTEILTDINYRSYVTYSVEDSYSDFEGVIESYKIDVYKDDVLVESQDYNVEQDGAIFDIYFKEVGTYKAIVTVKDNYLDVDSAETIQFAITKTAPTVVYTMTQDEQYPDLLHFNFSETYSADGLEISSYILYIYQDGTQVGSHHSRTPVFDYFIPIRGDFEIKSVVYNSGFRASEEIIIPLNYLDADLPVSKLVQQSTGGIHYSDPRIFYQNVIATTDYTDFGKWILRGTSTTGESYQKEITVLEKWFGLYQGYEVVRLNHAVSGPGSWTLETIYVDQSGFEYRPLVQTVEFEYDLGVASFDMEVTPVTQGNTKHNFFEISNASSGNYGSYDGPIVCDFTHQSSGESQTHDFVITWPGVSQKDLWFDKLGTWDVSCIGKTNTDLIAFNEFSFEVTNALPVVTLGSTLLGGRFYEFHVTAMDSDGSIVSNYVVLTNPLGDIEEVQVGNSIIKNLNMPGTWSVYGKSVDNDGGIDFSNSIEIYIESITPVADLKLTKVDESNYVLDASESSDADDEVAGYKFTISSVIHGSFDIIQEQAVLNHILITMESGQLN